MSTMALSLASIAIYPIKSLAGIDLTVASVEPRGLRLDWRWMVVDAAGTALTQRDFPRMALIRVTVDDDGLVCSAPWRDPLRIPFTIAQSATRMVTITRDECPALDVGDGSARWLSDYIGIECRLVTMPETTRRQVSQDYGGPDDVVSFADNYPFLLIGANSLADLNQRLEQPLPMNRFRPNFVIDGGAPFAEDGWKRIRIGSVAFRVVKPCARCDMPTVDQARGIFAGKEPLKTLATFRKHGSKVLFGQHLIADGAGTIRVGDPVEIVD